MLLLLLLLLLLPPPPPLLLLLLPLLLLLLLPPLSHTSVFPNGHIPFNAVFFSARISFYLTRMVY